MYSNSEMRKLTKIILLEVGIEDLKIRSRDNNRCKSANKRTETQLRSKLRLIRRIEY